MKLNSAIENRWSPTAFSNKNISDEMLELLFEAARKAPSSRNTQPWNYFYARRENKDVFNSLVEILTGNNPQWAKKAPILMISVMKKTHNHKNKPNSKALHDTGAANISLAIQASEMGLQVHQMGGFDKEKASRYLNLDSSLFEPVTMIAIGFPDESAENREDTKNRIQQHNTRKNLEEFVFQLK